MKAIVTINGTIVPFSKIVSLHNQGDKYYFRDITGMIHVTNDKYFLKFKKWLKK